MLEIKQGATPFTGGEKLCRVCKVLKPLNFFHAGRRYRDGYKTICRQCHGARYNKKSGYESPSAIRARVESQARRDAWLSEIIFCKKCGRSTQRKHWPRQGGRAYGGFRTTCCSDPRIKNRKPITATRGRQEATVADAYRAWDWWLYSGAPQQWINDHFAVRGDPWNSPRVSPCEREKIRKNLDPDYAVACRLRVQFHKHQKKGKINCILRGALKRNGESDFAKLTLGYTIADLRRHIERQFSSGMNWTAFASGRIHIDHIIPVSSFDLTNDEGIRRCWALSNLRPMWARDNIVKSSRREHLL